MSGAQKSRTVLVRRYARSRLFDVTNGCYATVEQLRRWVADGIAFSVIDVETGEDITRVLLA